MSDRIDLSGKVAIVTGAGTGLGRSHALLLASRGASVVVNDLGVDVAGRGRTSAAAEAVAGIIRQTGGIAVADAGDIASRDGAIGLYETAIHRFGKVDIVVNNAGFLRDSLFHKAEIEDLEVVLDVHLNGPMYLAHAAYPGMRERRFGRIVFTSSVSGVYGNRGQAAYAMGKAGVLGLMMTIAMEGASYNVLSNAIMPMALSRMSEELMPAVFQDAAAPEHVSALVAYLASPTCMLNGNTIAAGAGMFAAVSSIEARGVHFNPAQPIQPEDVAARVEEIVDLDQPYYTKDLTGSLDRIREGIQMKRYTKVEGHVGDKHD